MSKTKERSAKEIREQKMREEHQRDPNVWTRDYAQRQKEKTLAMIGRIDVEQILSSRADALSSRNNDDTEGILETDS